MGRAMRIFARLRRTWKPPLNFAGSRENSSSLKPSPASTVLALYVSSRPSSLSGRLRHASARTDLSLKEMCWERWRIV